MITYLLNKASGSISCFAIIHTEVTLRAILVSLDKQTTSINFYMMLENKILSVCINIMHNHKLGCQNKLHNGFTK